MYRLRLLLAAATLIPIVVLVWLGASILRQERDVERQHARENLEVAAGRLSLAINQRFGEIEERLSRGEGLRLTAQGIEAAADSALLYQPRSVPVSDMPDVFGGPELEEFKNQDLPAAATAYERLAGSQAGAVRARALLGLARVQRKLGDATAALAAYTKLEQLGPVPVGGDIAPLIARQGRVKLFQETGQAEPFRMERDGLARFLYAGKLPIDRDTFNFYLDLLRGWGASPPPAESVMYTAAAIQLWQSWQAGELSASGRRVVREDGVPVLTIWTHNVLWVATPGRIQEIVGPLALSRQLRVSISDVEGGAILGRAIPGGISVAPADSRLPFIIQAAAVHAGTAPERIVLISGLTLAFIVMAAAALTLYRVTTRELMLAQQQSDFVSAVSHEFRTPLTSMRHLTELLVSGSVASEERKATYYELLAHETERLHRLVESLLSFGRIEAGAYAFHLEPTDVGDFVGQIIDEFRGEDAARGRDIIYERVSAPRRTSIDREALSRALWNLLENAAKYSESGKPIRAFVRQQAGSVLVGVEDQGQGIPPAEREKIFQKFVRGSDAKRLGVRGVGIGLALVKRIAEAHGGTVRVESEVGRGSTFIVVIPCPEF